MNDGKRQVMGESKPDENLIATIHYENGTELTGKAVTLQDGTMLRDAVGLTLGEASDAYETWLNGVRRNAIEDWVDSLPIRESTRLHCKYLDRDGAGHPKEEEDAWR